MHPSAGTAGVSSPTSALRPDQDQDWKPVVLWFLRGNAHAELGDWKDAVADFTRAAGDASKDAELQVDLALVHLAANDLEKYRTACLRLLHDFGRGIAFGFEDKFAWTCTLVPAALPRWDGLIQWAKAEIEIAPEDSDKSIHDLSRVLAAATYRAGRYEETIGHLRAAMKAMPAKSGPPNPKSEPATAGGPPPDDTAGGDAFDWLFLSMAHHRLGHRDEARKWLDKAIAAIDAATKSPPDDASSKSRIDWKTRLAYRVLRAEAEKLIGAGKAATPNPGAP